jgi:hypothetical protein
VNRTVRAEFAPLYLVRSVPFAQLGRLLSSYQQAENRLPSRVASIFSAFDCKLAESPGINITPLFAIDLRSDAFIDLLLGFEIDFDYNGRVGSPHVRAVCRLVCSQSA